MKKFKDGLLTTINGDPNAPSNLYVCKDGVLRNLTFFPDTYIVGIYNHRPPPPFGQFSHYDIRYIPMMRKNGCPEYIQLMNYLLQREVYRINKK